eukprot:ctg_1134.g463
MSDSKPISVKDRLAYFLRREHEANGADRLPESRADRSDGADEVPPTRGAPRSWLGWRRPADDTSKSSVNDSGTDTQRSLLADRRSGASRMQRVPPKMALPPTPPSVPATPLQEHNAGATASPRRQQDKRRSGRRASIIRTPVPQTPRSGSPTDIATSRRSPTSPTAPAVHRPPTSLPSRRVLCVLCDDVEDTEFFVAHAALTVAGYAVDVSSPSAPRAHSVVRSVIRVTDSTSCEAILRAADLDGHRIVTNVDFAATAAAIDDAADCYEALLLPGGRLSTANTLSIAHPALLSLIRMFHARGRLIAAVSTAPVLLSAAGVTTAGQAGISLTAHPLLRDRRQAAQRRIGRGGRGRWQRGDGGVLAGPSAVPLAGVVYAGRHRVRQRSARAGADRHRLRGDRDPHLRTSATDAGVDGGCGVAAAAATHRGSRCRPALRPSTVLHGGARVRGADRGIRILHGGHAAAADRARETVALVRGQRGRRDHRIAVRLRRHHHYGRLGGVAPAGDPRVLHMARQAAAGGVGRGNRAWCWAPSARARRCCWQPPWPPGCNTVREVTGYPAYVPPGSGFVQPQSPLDVHQDGHV